MRLFRFPADENRRAKWVDFCKRDEWQPTESSRLCEVHFEQSEYECNRADGRKLLKWNAIPTLFNVPKSSKILKSERKHPIERNQKEEEDINENPVPEETTLTEVPENKLTVWVQEKHKKIKLQIKQLAKKQYAKTKRLGYTESTQGVCSAENCGNRSPENKLFMFPLCSKRRAEWVKNMEIDDWTPTRTSRLCEKHFEESQFEQNQKDRWKKLKGNAIPTLFTVSNPPAVTSPLSPQRSLGKKKLIGNAETSYNEEPQGFRDGETFLSKSSVTSDCDEIEKDSEKTLEEHVIENVKANLCRVCGCSGGSLTPIFEEAGSILFHGVPLLKVLEMYLSLKVSIDDPFPSSICYTCHDTLDKWHQFYLTCVAANESFKNLFGGGNDQEPSNCTINNSSVWEDTSVITKLFKNDHNYVKVELEKSEEMEEDVDGDINVDDFYELNMEIRENNQSSKDKPSFCKYCYHTLNDTVEIELHGLQNEDTISDAYLSRPTLCKFCQQPYFTMNDMKSHVELCKEQPTVCDECGKVLLHRKLLPAHKYRKHHNFLRVCEKCGISVPSKYYSRHNDAFHSGSYYCNLCCTVLKSKIMYNEHMRKHEKGEIKSRLKINPFPTEDGVPMYQCPVCGDLYKDLPTMIVHLNESKTIQCSSCSLKFNNEKRLAIHNCKKWECRFCHKSFFSRERFMEHERIHTGQKPYKCDFCSASFKRKNQRIVHQRTHSAPSHECKYCGKKFKLAVSLSNHINAHEGVYFSCTFCEKKFPGEKYLQKHMKTHEID